MTAVPAPDEVSSFKVDDRTRPILTDPQLSGSSKCPQVLQTGVQTVEPATLEDGDFCQDGVALAFSTKSHRMSAQRWE